MKYSLLKVNPESEEPIMGIMPASEVEHIIVKMRDVCACFELNGVDAPILRGVKSYGRAMAWRNADLLNRYFVIFTLDAEPEVSPPRDLFEWAERQDKDVTQ